LPDEDFQAFAATIKNQYEQRSMAWQTGPARMATLSSLLTLNIFPL
jgi:hypothetical protein